MNLKCVLKRLFQVVLFFILLALLTGLSSVVVSLLFFGKVDMDALYGNNLAALFSTIGPFLAPILFVKLVLKEDLGYLFIERDQFFKKAGLGLLGGWGQITAFVILALLFDLIAISRWQFENLNGLFFLYLLGFFIQSASEELLVRGLLTRALDNTFGRLIALYLPSIVFGLLHLANDGVTVISTVNTVLSGLFFAKLLFYSENIWVASGFHADWNFSMSLIYGFNVSGITGFQGLMEFKLLNPNGMGLYGPEGTWIVTIIEIVSIVIVTLLEKRRETTHRGIAPSSGR